MIIAALFTIARTRKRAKCPSTDEWIKTVWYIYTMEYYPVIKRHKTGSFAELWMNLESVMQSEVSQKEGKKKEKSKYCILIHVCGIYKDATDEPISRAGIGMKTQKVDMGKGQSGMNWEAGIDIYTQPSVKQLVGPAL